MRQSVHGFMVQRVTEVEGMVWGGMVSGGGWVGGKAKGAMGRTTSVAGSQCSYSVVGT